MNKNNILKNQTRTQQFKKTYIKKKTCKTYDLCHKTEINL